MRLRRGRWTTATDFLRSALTVDAAPYPWAHGAVATTMARMKPNKTADVAVVGGGAVGVCIALELAGRGASVVLLERGAELAWACSAGNAGIVGSSHVMPLADPAAVRDGIRWMARPDSPFYVRPRPRVLPWLLRFAAAANPAQVKRHRADRARSSSTSSRPLSNPAGAERRALVAAGARRGGGGCMTVWTIGHSTHELERFLSLLARHDIDVLADVRAAPHSRRRPHFEQAALERSLPERGVAYVHLSGLGGWRRPAADSPNGGWRNRSFRGYADYAMGREFGRGLAELRELAANRRVAAMCSEAQW